MMIFDLMIFDFVGISDRGKRISDLPFEEGGQVLLQRGLSPTAASIFEVLLSIDLDVAPVGIDVRHSVSDLNHVLE